MAMDNNNKGQQEIGKEPDPTNPEDLSDLYLPLYASFQQKEV